MSTPTILIAEDDFVIREGLLKPALEPHCVVVASVGNGREAVAAAAKYKPAIALLDVSLPGLHGIEAARQILAADPGCKYCLFPTTATEPTREPPEKWEQAVTS
jgi:CheY-like chemotaxis protein